MTSADLQSLCEIGQQQLMLMDYLAAESTLVQAEQAALELADFDTLARLYMPLQEARRQRRQRCGEGTVNLKLIAPAPIDLQPESLIDRYPQGQLLIAGWGTIEPATRLRELAEQRRLYVETYLAAVFPVDDGSRAIAIVSSADVQLPKPTPRPIDQLIALLPPHTLLLHEDDLPDPRPGDFETYAQTMSIWEQLHMPFLAAADEQTNPMHKMNGYRQAISVDYACELAHQKLSDVARNYAREMRTIATGAGTSVIPI